MLFSLLPLCGVSSTITVSVSLQIVEHPLLHLCFTFAYAGNVGDTFFIIEEVRSFGGTSFLRGFVFQRGQKSLRCPRMALLVRRCRNWVALLHCNGAMGPGSGNGNSLQERPEGGRNAPVRVLRGAFSTLRPSQGCHGLCGGWVCMCSHRHPLLCQFQCHPRMLRCLYDSAVACHIQYRPNFILVTRRVC